MNKLNFVEEIKNAKPHASENSIKTYNSILRTIHKNVFIGQSKNMELFKQYDLIINFLNSKPSNVRKTYLSALQAIAPCNQYKKLLMEDIRFHNSNIQNYEINEKLENSIITDDELEKIHKNLNKLQEISYKSVSLDMDCLQNIQNWVILNLYNGHIIPRNSLDYILMKYKNFDTETDNYIDFENKIFVFNRYKNDKHKGKQIIKIPSSLMVILIKWVLVIPDDVDYLLFNTNKEPLSSVTLTQRLNIIFNGKKSINALRDYYLTKNYKNLLNDLEEI